MPLSIGDKAKGLAISYNAFRHALEADDGPERDRDLIIWGRLLADDAEELGAWTDADRTAWRSIASRAEARQRLRGALIASVELTKPADAA